MWAGGHRCSLSRPVPSPSTHSHDPVLGIQDPRLVFTSNLLDLPELLSISMLTWRRLGSVSVSATVCGSKTFFEVVPDPSGRLALGWAGASVLGPPRPARPVLSPPRPALAWTQLQPPCQECKITTLPGPPPLFLPPTTWGMFAFRHPVFVAF